MGLVNCLLCLVMHERRDFLKHEDSCLEIEIKCKDCEETFKRKDEELHISNICPFAKVKCRKCSCFYVRSQKESHDCIQSLVAKQEKTEIKFLEFMQKI